MTLSHSPTSPTSCSASSRVAPRATSFTRCYRGTGDRTALPRQPPHSHSHALCRHHVNGALGHVAPGDRRLGSRCPATQPDGAGWPIKVTSRCWGGDVSQPIIPPRSESDELRTPLRWNPASIAIPQPPPQRRSDNILRHALVAASIEGVRDAAVPLTALGRRRRYRLLAVRRRRIVDDHRGLPG